MSSIGKRTPTGKWGKMHEGAFNVSSGSGEIVDGRPTSRLKSVTVLIGDHIIQLDRSHVQEINAFIERSENIMEREK